MKALALRCPSRLPIISFPMMNIMETDGPEICRQPVSYSVYLFFFHISCLLLHNLVNFKLTNLWSLVKLLFWAQRSGKIIWLIPRSKMHLIPKTRVSLPPFLAKASLRLSRVFPSYIYSVPSLFFFISF